MTPRYKLTLEFQNQSDYDEFIEMQTEYPKLRRFIEEFEKEIRNWRKHDAIPTLLKPLDLEAYMSQLFAHEIERWYYATKEEWTNER